MLKIIKTITQIILGLVLALVLTFIIYFGYVVIKYPETDCQNTNQVFEDHTYDSKKYQLELIKLLKASDIEDTRFWLGTYIDPTHITFRMQNEKICAEGLITVHKLQGKGAFMNHLMSSKGISWNGPLVGVQFIYNEDPSNPEIILAGIDDIID